MFVVRNPLLSLLGTAKLHSGSNGHSTIGYENVPGRLAWPADLAIGDLRVNLKDCSTAECGQSTIRYENVPWQTYMACVEKSMYHSERCG